MGTPAVAGSATPQPLDGDFRVDGGSPPLHRRPSIASLADGGFVVVWIAESLNFQSREVRGRRYDADGQPRGPDVRLDDGEPVSAEGGTQPAVSFFTRPAVVGLNDGGFLVTWDIADDGDWSGVVARRFGADGTAEGASFPVNSHVPGYQFAPAAAALAGGGVLIGWVSANQDGSGHGVYGQRYDAVGTPLGEETLLSTTTAGDQNGISLAALADGGMLATWLSGPLFTNEREVRGQRYDAAGLRRGGEFRIDSDSLGHSGPTQDSRPAAAGLRGGGFVVVWVDQNRVSPVGRLYDGTGVPVGEEFPVPDGGRGQDQSGPPAVVGLADGGFLVAWESLGDDLAQRFDATATAVGETFLLDRSSSPDATFTDTPPGLAAGAAGGFTGTWGSWLEIHGQRFATYGPFAFSLPEGAAAGTMVGEAAHAVLGSATYGISGGNADGDGDGTPPFALDPLTGLLRVADGDELDFETEPEWFLEIRASAAGGLTDTGTVTVRLSDADEPGNEWPRLAAQAFTVAERSPAGTKVGVLVVTDVDAGDSHHFALTAGNPDRDGDGVPAFHLEAGTGVLSVADGDDLDFETTPEIPLSVTVTDAGGLSDEAIVTVQLLDGYEIAGTEGDDFLYGAQGPDRLDGRGGDDRLSGRLGDDTLLGGSGVDRVEEWPAGDARLDDGHLSGVGEDALEGIERARLAAPLVIHGNVDPGRHLDASGFGRGAVQLVGGDGDDTLLAPAEAGSAHAGRRGVDGDARLSHNVLSGGDGNDTLTGGAGFDALEEEFNGDVVLGAGLLTGRGTDRFSSIEFAHLIGGYDDQRLDASGFDGQSTQLEGGYGNDTLIGGAAIDVLKFAQDVPTIRLSDAELVVELETVHWGRRWIDTLVEIDAAKLIGGDAPTTIDASAFTGRQVLYEGGDGDDVLIGRELGSDRVRARFAGSEWSGAPITFRLTDSELSGQGTDRLQEIEEAELLGGPGDDSFNVSAFSGHLTILEGGPGDDLYRGRVGGIDRVRARGNVDFVLTDGRLTGEGSDLLVDIDEVELIGDGDANRLDASAFSRGPVLLYGECGDDRLLGGAGDDLLSGGPGNDSLDGGAGLDRIEGRGDTDFLLGAATLSGLGLDAFAGIEEAVLGGGPGANVLDASGFGGRLVIFEGQQGDDTLIGRSEGLDRVRAEGDADFLLSDDRLTGLGNDTLIGIDEAELIGFSGSNEFDARSFHRGPVLLDGGSGDDTLYGSAAADTLLGGAGADRLSGQAGADLFVLTVLAESRLARPDRLLDYAGAGATPDRIDAPDGIAAVLLTASVGEAAGDGEAALQALLTPAVLGAGAAAAFTIAGRGGTFLALGDPTPGFQAGGDGLLELPDLLLSPASPIVVI